jgi:hypothetical protein
MNYYLYEGTISQSLDGCRRITLRDARNDDKPPVALWVPCKGLAQYLEARSWCDEAERYLTQGWIYDSNLFLQAVVIPGSLPGIPAKVIACRDLTRYPMDAVVFGPEELLNTDAPESMGPEAFQDWLEFRTAFRLCPRNQENLGETCY